MTVRDPYDEAVEAIYSAALSPEAWSTALERAAAFVGGIGGMVVANDFRARKAEMVTGGLRDDLDELYAERHSSNLTTQAVFQQREFGRVLDMNGLVDRTSLRRSELYADVLAPQGIDNILVLPTIALSPEGGIGGFAIPLNSRQAEDSENAVARMTRLSPHLTRAFDLSLEVARHQEEALRQGALLDVLPSAAMLLDRRGRIARANTAAERLLASGDGLTASPGAILGASLPAEDRRFRRAVLEINLHLAQAPQVPAKQALSISRSVGVPALLVILTPLPPVSFRFLDVMDTQATLLVRVFDPMLSHREQSEVLREAYGLTPAEARVAIEVALGQSTPVVAARLGISITTVRTHLARTFDKTGTHSQVALARLLNTLGSHPEAPGKG